MEQQAPITKQIAVPQLMNRPIRMKSTTINTASTLYSENRNARAPSLMAEAMFCMVSFPAGALDTTDAL